MAQPESRPLPKGLNAILEDLTRRADLRHAVMAVERGDGSFRWSGAAGAADTTGTPMRADTPFFIASITKLFIAVLVMKLHERRALDIDDTIRTYLPAAQVDGIHTFRGTDHSGRITVRHLLSHTSGLPDYIEERPPGSPSLVERLVTEGDQTWTMDEILRIVRALRPHFPPQSQAERRMRARYSDTNYRLLIAIAEAVTREPLHRSLEERLFRPLGLHRTWHPDGAPLVLTPEPATLWFGAEPLTIPLTAASVGDLYSTTGDLLAFLRAVMSGAAFDDPATGRLLQERWVRFGFPRDRAALRAPGWPIEYGLGVMRFELPWFVAPFNRVPAVIGHTGSTGTWLFHCPDLDLYLAGAVDQGTAGAVPFRTVPRVLRLMTGR